MINLKNELPLATCPAAYDLLSKAYKARGFLPNGKKPKDYDDSTAQELFDALETVANDENYWNRFPNITRPDQQKLKRAQKNVNEIIKTTMNKQARILSIDGTTLESGLRLDMLVEKCVIVELKSVENMNPVYEAQLMTYLRLSKLRLGFLINFNVPHLKDGIKRMVL